MRQIVASRGCVREPKGFTLQKTTTRGSMRHVMILNSKGGCGKSTLASNVAVFFARDGHQVCIADYDPQRSSLDWLAQRPAALPPISRVAAYDGGPRNGGRNARPICPPSAAWRRTTRDCAMWRAAPRSW